MTTTESKAYRVAMDKSRTLAALKPSTVPPVLHHYTNRAGLLGIVTSGQVYASHVLFLNDSREFLYAESLAQEIVERRSQQTRLPELYKALTRFFEGRRFGPHLRSVFVFSMSENPDQLSQWRAYCDPGNGYSIGFHTELLQSIVASELTLFRCSYDRSEHERLIEGVLTEAEEDLERNRAAGVAEGDLSVGALAFFLLGLLSLAPVLKHPTFHEEKEWRLVSSPRDLKEAKYRASPSLLVPYRPVPIRENDLIPVVRVLVGPGPHPDLDEMAVSGLFDGQTSPPCVVERSRIPFRSW